MKNMYKGFSIRLLHQPAEADVEALFTRAVSHGANAVSLVTHNYVYVPNGTSVATYPLPEMRTRMLVYEDIGREVARPYANTTSPLLVRQIALDAEDVGLRVMLKPHIDASYGGWRYWVQFEGVAYHFQAAYRAFLTPYLNIAKDLRDPIFCMGCELGSITLSQNKYLGVAFWQRQAKWIRSQGYKGALTYAANWGQEADALSALWSMPEITYGGIDAYYSLQYGDQAPSPTYDQIRAAWDLPSGPESWYPVPSAQLPRLSAQAGKPFLFTEAGYSNHSLTLFNPGGEAPLGAVRDDRLQANAYRALLDRFRTEPGYAGVFWWEMLMAPLPDISHSIVDRPAEDIAFT